MQDQVAYHDLIFEAKAGEGRERERRRDSERRISKCDKNHKHENKRTVRGLRIGSHDGIGFFKQLHIVYTS